LDVIIINYSRRHPPPPAQSTSQGRTISELLASGLKTVEPASDYQQEQ
jgi:hypothetical protein